MSWITLNRPDAANAITYQQRNHVIELLEPASVFDDESYAQELAMHTVDANEGVAAFVEHRNPTFRGR